MDEVGAARAAASTTRRAAPLRLTRGGGAATKLGCFGSRDNGRRFSQSRPAHFGGHIQDTRVRNVFALSSDLLGAVIDPLFDKALEVKQKREWVRVNRYISIVMLRATTS